ncbi:MAG: hypothetical protein CVU05_01285 [Bacteroidetes bacterium HGW-Bacteroidetes-21]|jgi:type IX secretion system PorP/SprF family membrane protein|nr:MAG: hypothetical protein CVU05_01285 [Bacteroidetes bacterium HGW-Bacteroidetes-21]
MCLSIVRKTGLLALLVISALTGKAQFFQHYSHYHMNGFIINPAYAGSRDVMSAVFLHRDQWIGFPGAPVTQTLSMHSPLKNINSAVGINIFNDKISVSRHTGIFFDYAYRFKTGKNSRLSLGLSAGISFFRSALGEIQTTTGNDQAFDGTNFKYTTPNFGFGMFYTGKRFFAGLSWPLMVKYASDLSNNIPDSLMVSPINRFLQAGYIFKLNDDLDIKTTIMIRNYEQFEGQLDLTAGLIVYKTLLIGFAIRSKDAFTGLIEFQVNDKFRIGYAHDFVTSGLAKYTHGSNEIVLRYEPVFKTAFSNTRFF